MSAIDPRQVLRQPAPVRAAERPRGPLHLLWARRKRESDQGEGRPLTPSVCRADSQTDCQRQDKGTGGSAGYGFVKFQDRGNAEAALKALNGKAYLGQELRVNWALPNGTKEDTSAHFHIFVGDLGCDVTDAQLHSSFSAVGQCS